MYRLGTNHTEKKRIGETPHQAATTTQTVSICAASIRYYYIYKFNELELKWWAWVVIDSITTSVARPGLLYWSGCRRANEEHRLPYGLKLGAVISDDCAMPVTALARALQFLPLKADDGCRPVCFHSNSSCNISTKQTRPDVQSLSPLDFFNVVGVIAAESSPSSVIVANLLSMFTIPQVSARAAQCSNLIYLLLHRCFYIKPLRHWMALCVLMCR